MSKPLTPADCDLRDFAFMPLDPGRLFGSEFHALANDSEWRAGVCLWLKSWHQVPAASLPNDDTMLCRLAEFGRDMRSWRKVRDVALRGWVLCDDGRLYHPTVAEKAAEAWARKQAFRARTEKARQARRGHRDDRKNGSVTGPVDGSVTDAVTATTGTGTGTGTIESPLPPGGGRKAPRTKIPDGYPDAEAIAAQQARCRDAGADVNVEYQADRFRGWAEANDARYAQWPATWRNWMTKAIEDAPKRVGHGINADEPINWTLRADAWRRDGTWLGAWGPTPRERGCQCPKELLEG